MGDRVKQTLFAILEPDLPGARVLDLFAGSGAAGIEALSRGARATPTFVERDPAAIRVIARATSGGPHLAGPARPDRPDASVGAGSADGARAAAGAVRRRARRPALRPTPSCSADGARRRSGPLRLGPDGAVVAKHFWRDPAAGARSGC